MGLLVDIRRQSRNDHINGFQPTTTNHIGARMLALLWVVMEETFDLSVHNRHLPSFLYILRHLQLHELLPGTERAVHPRGRIR